MSPVAAAMKTTTTATAGVGGDGGGGMNEEHGRASSLVNDGRTWERL